MDSILVVDYSWTGVSRRAAQLLASHHGWPLGEIRDVHFRAGVLGGARCVIDSLFRRRPAILYLGPDPGDFRTVVLVSPIWAYQMASPMRSFLHEHGPRIQRFAQVTLMNAAGASNAVGEAARLLGHPAVLTAEFIPTARNKPAETYFSAQGFHIDETAAGEKEAYVLYKAEVETLDCDWIKTKGDHLWNSDTSTLSEYS